MILSLATCAFATDYEWAGEASALGKTTGVNWTDGLNWSNVSFSTYNDGYPDGIGDWAMFSMTNTTHPNITITDDITLGGWTNVKNEVNQNPTWWQDRIVGTVTGAGSITFDNGAGASYLTWNVGDNRWRDSGDQAFSVDIILAGDLHYEWNTERDRILDSTITGTGDLYVNWLGTSSRLRIAGTAPNTYSGDTYINIGSFYEGGARVELSKDGAVAGDVYIGRASGYWNLDEVDVFVIITPSGAEDRVPDTSSVFLKSFNAGAEHTILDLDAGVDETVAGLYFDGAAQLPGLWGATGSTPTPDYINDDYFSGEGVLRVVVPPPTGTLILLR